MKEGKKINNLENQKTIQNIIEILNSEKEFFYPVKKLWYELHNRVYDFKLSLEQLKALLKENDKIFKYYDFDEPKEIDEINEIRMRELGYWMGDRVMLAWRTPKKGELIQATLEQLTKMMNALEMAYEGCSIEDEEGRVHLIELLNRAKELKEKLEEEMEKEG